VKKLMSFFTIFTLLIFASSTFAVSGEGDPKILKKMHKMNRKLAKKGLHIAIEQIDVFTIGGGRPPNRIHQQEFRWVANDPRRLADGTNITYIVDQSGGATANGLTNADTEPAIDRSFGTWEAENCLKKVDLIKRDDPGTDITIFDALIGLGGLGDPFAADIVDAGWFPQDFFDTALNNCGGPDCCGVIAFSVSFIFVDDDGNPTDINGDNRLDTALNEVYYNSVFGGDPADCGGRFADNPWGIDVALPGIDVETVALHENGHSLGVGHFGPPPNAVMNPVYAGIRHELFSADHAGMCTVWASWPK
jgi:hypothetical protein